MPIIKSAAALAEDALKALGDQLFAVPKASTHLPPKVHIPKPAPPTSTQVPVSKTPFIPKPVEQARARLSGPTERARSYEAKVTEQQELKAAQRANDVFTSFNVMPDRDGSVRFVAAPRRTPITTAEEAAGPLNLARKADIETKAKRTAIRQADTDVPRLFGYEDISSVDNAYTWARKHFIKFTKLFNPKDKRLYKRAIQTSPYRNKGTAFVPKGDGGYYKFNNPIKLDQWIRAASILSHEVDTHSILRFIQDVKVPEDIVDIWDPLDPKKWRAVKERVVEIEDLLRVEDRIDPSIAKANKATLDLEGSKSSGLRAIQDEGISLEDYHTNRGFTQVTVDDLRLIRAVNQVEQFMYGKNTVVSKAINRGLTRLYGHTDFNANDGSVDALLYAFDNLQLEYNRLEAGNFGASIRMLFKAFDDLARGGMNTPRGQAPPSLKLIDSYLKEQAIKDAYSERIKYDDVTAFMRAHEQSSLFDESISPAMPGAKYGGAEATKLTDLDIEGKLGAGAKRGVQADEPRTASSLKERQARSDIAAGYTGQSDRLDYEWTAMKGKGITEFNYADHVLPGEMQAGALHEAEQAVAKAELELDSTFLTGDDELDYMSWDDLITTKYLRTIDADTDSVNLEQLGIALGEGQASVTDIDAEKAFARFASTKAATSILTQIGSSPAAPRLSLDRVLGGFKTGQINILRINNGDDFKAFVAELYNARHADVKSTKVASEFYQEFATNEDFKALTGIQVGKRVPAARRDALYSGMVVVRDAIVRRTELMEAGTASPLAHFTEKVILGKLLNIGEALNLGIQGVNVTKIDNMMAAWDLTATSSAELAKRVYSVAHINYAQVYKDTFDTMEVDMAIRIINADGLNGLNSVLSSRSGVDISTTAQQASLDRAKRKLIAAIRNEEFVEAETKAQAEITKPVTKLRKATETQSAPSEN